jgi:peptidoglycan/xylan/chitin deacetylase (PgdA/CDA1 family)
MWDDRMSRSQFIGALDRYAGENRTILLWLRDDDAIEPTQALSRLIDLSDGHAAPMTIASIPAHAISALADFLRIKPLISVAVHGWDHVNHASAQEKKQELGPHRDESLVLSQLGEGLARIRSLFGGTAVPMLVPPWNRISPALIDRLPALGYEALSVFGPERQGAIKLVNTQVDIIDWKGSRGGREADILYGEAAAYLDGQHGQSPSLGILTHHLVHDGAAWRFLDDFLALTTGHPACRWVSVRELMQPA